MYGGSTGGWEALGVQVLYPDFYNGCFAACPDPIDFRQYTVIDLYTDRNAFFTEGPWRKVPRPGHRNYLGHVSTTVEAMNRLELVLGEKGRSGGQWDIWQAVYLAGRRGRLPEADLGQADGRDRPRRGGLLARALRHRPHPARDWAKIGPKLRGKIHIYVGRGRQLLPEQRGLPRRGLPEATKTPPYEGVVDYEPRAEHCWNGDHTQPNAISRLRYAQMFAPKIVERILATAPPGADVKSWRY